MKFHNQPLAVRQTVVTITVVASFQAVSCAVAAIPCMSYDAEHNILQPLHALNAHPVESHVRQECTNLEQVSCVSAMRIRVPKYHRNFAAAAANVFFAVYQAPIGHSVFSEHLERIVVEQTY